MDFFDFSLLTAEVKDFFEDVFDGKLCEARDLGAGEREEVDELFSIEDGAERHGFDGLACELDPLDDWRGILAFAATKRT